MHGLHPNAQVVLQGFRAFAEGDMAAVKPLFHDDAIWHSSGRNRFSGDFRGVDAIMRLFAELSGAGHTAAGDDNDAFSEVVTQFVLR